MFENFRGKRILVIGDIMLDSYWWGKVDRISPEAPVPIVHIQKKEYRLGGAANVALNLSRLGALPLLCGVVGDDAEASTFFDILKNENIDYRAVISSSSRPTSVKTRVIGNKNQMLRIDSEVLESVTPEESSHLLGKILDLIQDCDLVVFEDYDKGLLNPGFIQSVISLAQQAGKMVVVDPKKKNFLAYKGATVFKPNLRELAEGLKMDIDAFSDNLTLCNAARTLLHDQDFKYVLLTLSERGILLVSAKDCFWLKGHARSVYDVSGAGDTVVSVASLAMLAGASPVLAAALANLAGGLVCEKAGVVPIDIKELTTESLQEFVSEY